MSDMIDQDESRLAEPMRYGPAGGIMARIRAKCIARYRLKAGRPGHPEELDQIGNERVGMSIVYGCFAVRVRLHHDYRWIATADFNPAVLPHGLDAAAIHRLFSILDPHFGWTPRGYPIIPAGPVDPQLMALHQPPHTIPEEAP